MDTISRQATRRYVSGSVKAVRLHQWYRPYFIRYVAQDCRLDGTREVGP